MNTTQQSSGTPQRVVRQLPPFARDLQLYNNRFHKSSKLNLKLDLTIFVFGNMFTFNYIYTKYISIVPFSWQNWHATRNSPATSQGKRHTHFLYDPHYLGKIKPLLKDKTLDKTQELALVSRIIRIKFRTNCFLQCINCFCLLFVAR